MYILASAASVTTSSVLLVDVFKRECLIFSEAVLWSPEAHVARVKMPCGVDYIQTETESFYGDRRWSHSVC